MWPWGDVYPKVSLLRAYVGTMIAYITPTPHDRTGDMMQENMIEDLISTAGIPDNDGAVTALLETLKPMIDRGLYLALENAVNFRVAQMQVAAFVAGMVASASGQDIQWHVAEIGADLEALRRLLGDALWRQRMATINGEDTTAPADEVGAILAEYRQKRARMEQLESIR